MANTVVVYAYNMWYPCTVYVHVYTQYVHAYAMYIHHDVLTSCLNMVGRVPLISLFLAGNSTPTIPQQYSQHKRSGFPVRSCHGDTVAADGRRGSNVYEVNLWLWQFGCGKPRLGDLSVEKTGARKASARKERFLRGAETSRRRRSTGKAADWPGPDGEMKCGCEAAQTCLYPLEAQAFETCSTA